MTQLRRCSPEIERELHDKEARIRGLEAENAKLRGRIAHAIGHVGEVVVTKNEDGDAVAATRQDEEGEILSVIWERGSEPAEGAEKCLVCDGSGNLYGHQPEGMYGYTPCHNCKGTGKPPIREAAEGEGGDPEPYWPVDEPAMQGEDDERTAEGEGKVFTQEQIDRGREKARKLAAYFNYEDAAEQQDAMLERRDALEALIHEINLRFTSGNGVAVERAHIKAHEWGQLSQVLSRTSDEGTGCVVPEVVSRYLDSIIDLERVTRQGGAEPEDLSDLEWAVQTAVQHAGDAKDELDRAIAEQGGQRVPEGGDDE